MATVKDIAKILASRHKLKGADAERFLQQMVEVINGGLLSDRVVKIKGFGTFKLQAVKDRASVNVNTGERVVIEGHDKVTFTPDSVMKEIINKPFAQFETVVIDDDSPLLKEGFSVMGDDEENYDDAIPADEEERTSVTEEQPAAVEEEPVTVEEEIAPAIEESAPVVEEPVSVPEESVPAAIEEQSQSAEEPASVMSEQPSAPEEERPSTPVMPLIDKSTTPVLKTENLTVLAENVTVVKEKEKVEETKAGEAAPPVTEQIQEKPKPEEVEPNNIASEIENNTETDDDTTIEEMEENKFKYSGLLTNIAIAIIFFALGYWAGNSNIFSDTLGFRGQVHEDSVTVAHPKVEKDSAATAEAPAAPSESKAPATPSEPKAPAPAEENATAPAPAAKNTATPAPAETPQQQKQEEKPLTQYNSDNRVKTGAYYIVGTETEVTVKEGQTLSSISKTYLGPGMECYVEAYNGTKEVKPGQKVKIPKLKMKKLRK